MNAIPRNSTVSPDELRQIGLFGALSDAVLEQLAATLAVSSPEAGQVLFREGDEARDMYVVLEGEMEVLKTSKHGVDARVALLGPRDWFGEMSILDVQRRSATVRAVVPARLLRITAADLDALYRRDIKSYALVILNLARELSRRLRVADGLVSEMVADILDSYVANPGRSHPV